MGNARNDKDIKPITTKARKNYLAWEPKYHTKNIIAFLFIKLLTIEMKRTQILMNKTIYISPSILELNQTVMYELWCDSVKPKYGGRAKLWYMDTENFVVYIKTEDIYVDIAKDVERRSATSNNEWGRPLPKGKN